MSKKSTSNKLSEETMDKLHMKNDIETMIKIKDKLETIPTYERNNDYCDIVKQVDKYLRVHCKHHFVSDLIDIDPDRSKRIMYCTICYITK